MAGCLVSLWVLRRVRRELLRNGMAESKTGFPRGKRQAARGEAPERLKHLEPGRSKGVGEEISILVGMEG